MTTSTIPHPPIVSRDQWLAERKALLAHEKELTKHYDRVNAERRRLSMVKIEKDYVFDGPNGKPSLKDLFEGRRQLIVYHFMLDPTWEKGCPGCTGCRCESHAFFVQFRRDAVKAHAFGPQRLHAPQKLPLRLHRNDCVK